MIEEKKMKKFKAINIMFLLVILVLSTILPVAASADEIQYPTDIDGYPVIFVQTQGNTPSLTNNMVILTIVDASSKTPDESLTKINNLEYLKNNKLPKGWVLEVIGGNDTSKDNYIKNHDATVELYKKTGPRILSSSATSGSFVNSDTNSNITPLIATTPSLAIIGNGDVPSQTIHSQSAEWVAPNVGFPENGYSALLNNGLTNLGYFLQAGQTYDNGGTWGHNQWSYDTIARDFTGMPYYYGDVYEFYVATQSNRTGIASCWNLSKGTFQVELIAGIIGDYFVRNNSSGINATSVFFENWNTNANWYTGFTNPISVTYCEDYTTSWKAWNSQYIAIQRGGTGYINNGMITGSLVNHGTAQFHLNLILLGQ